MSSPPSSNRFVLAVTSFDTVVDARLEKLRGHKSADYVMTAATHAGEFSLIWHLCGLTRGLIIGRHDQVIGLAVALGVESLVLNQCLKRVFRRARPTRSGDARFDIRTPLTSSFPSGHASAATFAAVTLIHWDGALSVALWGTLAVLVAMSRAYVRIHHASDVVGGVIAGAAMAWVAMPIFIATGLG